MKKLIMPLIALALAVCLAVCVKLSQQRQEINNVPIEETASPSHTVAPSPRPSHATTKKTSHKCEVCGKTATHDELKDIGEYYCDEHWQEMEQIINMMFD